MRANTSFDGYLVVSHVAVTAIVSPDPPPATGEVPLDEH